MVGSGGQAQIGTSSGQSRGQALVHSGNATCLWATGNKTRLDAFASGSNATPCYTITKRTTQVEYPVSVPSAGGPISPRAFLPTVPQPALRDAQL